MARNISNLERAIHEIIDDYFVKKFAGGYNQNEIEDDSDLDDIDGVNNYLENKRSGNTNRRNNGQGKVKDPDHDRRLKDNQGSKDDAA